MNACYGDVLVEGCEAQVSGTVGWICFYFGRAVYLIHAVENQNIVLAEVNEVESVSRGHDRQRDKDISNIVPTAVVEKGFPVRGACTFVSEIQILYTQH